MGNVCECLRTGGKYEDYDWAELPDDAKEAATTLGYTKKMWDKDKEPDCMKLDWEELSKEQQAAAEVLGYNEKMWEEED